MTARPVRFALMLADVATSPAVQQPDPQVNAVTTAAVGALVGSPLAAQPVAAAGSSAAVLGAADAVFQAARLLARLPRDRAVAAADRIATGYEDAGRAARADTYRALTTDIQRRAPWATPSEVDEQAQREIRYEQVFLQRSADRIRQALTAATGIADDAQREAAIRQALDTERRYALMRQQAMEGRLAEAARRMSAKQASPAGAYWKLDPGVKEHTLDCLAFGGKVWPWSVLDVWHPPLHAGCPCRLIPIGNAIAQGWMTADDIPDPADAKRRAAQIAHRYQLAEAAGVTPDEWHHALEEARGKAEERWLSQLRTADGEGWQAPLTMLEREHGWLAEGTPGPGRTVTLSKDGRTVRVRFGDGDGYRPSEVIEEGELAEAHRPHPHDPHIRLRFAKGTRFGGRFMTLGQTSPEARARAARRALDRMPESPAAVRLLRRGENRWIRGQRHHVPEAGAWRHVTADHTYTSPPGSTLVYRDGRLAHDGTHAVLPDLLPPREGPDAQRARDEATALAVSHEEQLVRDARDAVRALRPDRSPIQKGDDQFLTPLEAAGFRIAGTRHAGDSTTWDLIHPPTGSRLTVTAAPDGTARHVTWKPGREQEPPRDLPTSPPRSWSDFHDSLVDWGRRMSIAGGAGDSITQSVHIDTDRPDTAGVHEWDGEIAIGPDAASSLDRMGAWHRDYPGEPLPDSLAEDVYRTYQVAAHELLHGANPIDPYHYATDPGGRSLEEALTEELSHHAALARLRAEDQHDIIDWLARNKDSLAAAGNYWEYRNNLTALLNHLGIDPAKRSDILNTLKFHISDEGRLAYLASLAPPEHPMTADQVAAALDRNVGPNIPRLIVPLNLPDTEPDTAALSADGEPLRVGQHVVWLGGEGTVTDLERTPTGSVVWALTPGGELRAPEARDVHVMEGDTRPHRTGMSPVAMTTDFPDVEGVPTRTADRAARLAALEAGAEPLDDLEHGDLAWTVGTDAAASPPNDPVRLHLVGLFGEGKLREWAGAAWPVEVPAADVDVVDPRLELPGPDSLELRQAMALARLVPSDWEARVGERGREALGLWSPGVDRALRGDAVARAGLEARGVHAATLAESVSAAIRASGVVLPAGTRVWRLRAGEGARGPVSGVVSNDGFAVVSAYRPVARAGDELQRLDVEVPVAAVPHADGFLVDRGLAYRSSEGGLDRSGARVIRARSVELRAGKIAEREQDRAAHPQVPGLPVPSHPGFVEAAGEPSGAVGVAGSFEVGSGVFGPGVYFGGSGDGRRLDLAGRALFRPGSPGDASTLEAVLGDVASLGGQDRVTVNPLGNEERLIRAEDVARRLPPAADGVPRSPEWLVGTVREAGVGSGDGDSPGVRVLRALGYDGVDGREVGAPSVLFRPVARVGEPGDGAHRLPASEVPGFVAGAATGGVFVHRTDAATAREVLHGGFDLDRAAPGDLGAGVYVAPDTGGVGVRVAVALKSPLRGQEGVRTVGRALADARRELPGAPESEVSRSARTRLVAAGHDGLLAGTQAVVYDPQALRVLEPDLATPGSGGAVRGGRAGRWVWIRGVYRHVPRDEAWEETADQVRFSSPAGSTDVYRQEERVPGGGLTPPMIVSQAGVRGFHADVRDPRRGGTRREQGRTAPPPPPTPEPPAPEPPRPLRTHAFRVGQQVRVTPVGRPTFTGIVQERQPQPSAGSWDYKVKTPEGELVTVPESGLADAPGPFGAFPLTDAARTGLATLTPGGLAPGARPWPDVPVIYEPDNPRLVDDRRLPDGQLSVNREFFTLTSAQRAYELDRAFGNALAARMASGLEDGSDLQELQQLWTGGAFRRTDGDQEEWVDRFSLHGAIAETYARLMMAEPAGGVAWAERFPAAARAVGLAARDRQYMLPEPITAWLTGRSSGRPTPEGTESVGGRFAHDLLGKRGGEAMIKFREAGFKETVTPGGRTEMVGRRLNEDGSVDVVVLHFDENANGPVVEASGFTVPASADQHGEPGSPERLAFDVTGMSLMQMSRTLTEAGYVSVHNSYGTPRGYLWANEDAGVAIVMRSTVDDVQVIGAAQPIPIDPGARVMLLRRRANRVGSAGPTGPAALRPGDLRTEVDLAIQPRWRVLRELTSGQDSWVDYVFEREGDARNQPDMQHWRVHYRDGRVVEVGRPNDGPGMLPEDRYQELVRGPALRDALEQHAQRAARVNALAEQTRERLNAAARGERVPEVIPHDLSFREVNDALRRLEFHTSGNPRTLSSGQRSYTFKRGSVRLTVRTDGEGNTTVTGSRITRAPTTEDLGRARHAGGSMPPSRAAAIADVFGRADEVSGRKGTGVRLDRVAFVDAIANAAGYYRWHDGSIALGERMGPLLDEMAAKQARGEAFTPQENRRLYRAYQVMQHEVNHAINHAPRATNDDGDRGFEEALTEELAHVLVRDWLASHGLDSVIEWAQNNPEHMSVTGTYQRFRDNFRGLLDRAGVNEGDRQELMMRWKFQDSADDRRVELASMIVAHQGIPLEQAQQEVTTALTGDATTGAQSVRGFRPILDPWGGRQPERPWPARGGGQFMVGDKVRGPHGSVGIVTRRRDSGEIHVEFFEGPSAGSGYDYTPGSALYEGVTGLQQAFTRGQHVQSVGRHGAVESVDGEHVTVRWSHNNEVSTYTWQHAYDTLVPADGPAPEPVRPEPGPTPEGARPAWLTARAQVRVHPVGGRAFRGHIVSVDETAQTAVIQKQHRGGRPTVRVTVPWSTIRLHGDAPPPGPPEPPPPADDRANLSGRALLERLIAGDVVMIGDTPARVVRVDTVGSRVIFSTAAGERRVGMMSPSGRSVRWRIPGDPPPPAPTDRSGLSGHALMRELRVGDEVLLGTLGTRATVRLVASTAADFVVFDTPEGPVRVRIASELASTVRWPTGGAEPEPGRARLTGTRLAHQLLVGDVVRINAPPGGWEPGDGWWAHPPGDLFRVTGRNGQQIEGVYGGLPRTFTVTSAVAEHITWGGRGAEPPRPPEPEPTGPPPTPERGFPHNLRTGDIVSRGQGSRELIVHHVGKNGQVAVYDPLYAGGRGRYLSAAWAARLHHIARQDVSPEIVAGAQVKVLPPRGGNRRAYNARVISVDHATGDVTVRTTSGDTRIVGFPTIHRRDGSDMAPGRRWEVSGEGPPPGPGPEPGPGAAGSAEVEGGTIGVGARVFGHSSRLIATVTGFTNGNVSIRRSNGTTHNAGTHELTAIAISDDGSDIRRGMSVQRDGQLLGEVSSVRWLTPDNPEVQVGGEWIPARPLSLAGPVEIGTMRGRRGETPIRIGMRANIGNRGPGTVIGTGLTSWPDGERRILAREDGGTVHQVVAAQLSPIGEPPAAPDVSGDVEVRPLGQRLGEQHYRRRAAAAATALALGQKLGDATNVSHLREFWTAHGLPTRGEGIEMKFKVGSTYATPATAVARLYRELFKSEAAHNDLRDNHPREFELITGLAQGAGLPMPYWPEPRPPRPGGGPMPVGELFTEENLRLTYNGAFGALHTRVRTTDIYGDSANVKGTILDANDNAVGSFERRLTKVDGQLHDVYNAYMSIRQDVQGGGFARDFNRAAEAVYRAYGAEYVKVGANIDVGGYSWAATGFDWNVRGDTGKARESTQKVRYRENTALTQEERDYVEPFLYTGEGSLEGKLVHAWEVAQLSLPEGTITVDSSSGNRQVLRNGVDVTALLPDQGQSQLRQALRRGVTDDELIALVRRQLRHAIGKKLLLGTSWSGKKLLQQTVPGSPA